MTPLAFRHTLLFFCTLLACTQPLESSRGPDQGTSPGTAAGLNSNDWPTSTMTQQRDQHTATQLLDGRILVAGGYARVIEKHIVDSTRLTEIYNPATGTWNLQAEMKKYRFGHTATLLPNGQVLVVGGLADYGTLDQAELYDPVTDSWTVTGNMTHARAFHTATLLSDGRVLVVGGVNFKFLGSALPPHPELYDPRSRTWSVAAPLNDPRAFHTATRLHDGQVLVAGGMSDKGGTIRLDGERYEGDKERLVGLLHVRFLGSVEIYDPIENTWNSSLKPLSEARAAHSMTRLPGGELLVVGGFEKRDTEPIVVRLAGMHFYGVTSLASAWSYDVGGKSWKAEGSMGVARAFHTATLLPDGKLFVTGGNAEALSTELFVPADPSSAGPGSWVAGDNMTFPRFRHTATLLPGGRVLLAGGFHKDEEVLGSSVIVTPVNGEWRPADTGLGQVSRRQASITLLPNGKVLVAGGYDADKRVLRSAELYDPESGSWTHQEQAFKVARRAHTATLLPNRKVLVIGGYDAEGKALNSAELYDPEQGFSMTLMALSIERGEHTANLLPDGTVFVSGGRKTSGGIDLATAEELYNPSTNSWSRGKELSAAETHACHTSTALPDGRVLVVGGTSGLSQRVSAGLYRPWGGGDTATASMNEGRECHTATLLPNGKVLVVGGFENGGRARASAELYEPSANNGNGEWRPTTTRLSQARGGHTATLLSTGQVLVTGGFAKKEDDAPALNSYEVYEPTTNSWWTLQNLHLNEARAQHAAVLLPDGRLLVVGGNKSGTSFAEAYQASRLDQAPAPRITSVGPSKLEVGGPLTLQGKDFRGLLETSSGSSTTSTTDVPLLTLRSLESGRWIPIPTGDFSDSFVNVTLPGDLFVGPYMVNVTTRARTAGKVIFIEDTTAPAPPLLDLAPARDTQRQDATFVFSSTALDFQSFDCSLDDADFTPCYGSTWRQDNLLDGHHTFRVRARDTAGHIGIASEYIWRVDTQAPDVALTALERQSRDTSASFSLSSSAEDVAHFECSLDDAEFAPCSSPITYDGLKVGQHNLRARARDWADNVSLTPARREWTVMRGNYGVGCAASGASPALGGYWALLLLGLMKRRRPN